MKKQKRGRRSLPPQFLKRRVNVCLGPAVLAAGRERAQATGRSLSAYLADLVLADVLAEGAKAPGAGT